MSTPALAGVGFDINGRDYVPSSVPVLEQGITSASVQMLTKTLGAQLTIEGDKITLTENKDTLQMTVGSTVALLNGVEKTMPKAPEVTGDDILLPVRFVYESFGATVDWVGEQQKVAVSYAEKRNGMSTEEMLAESSRITQEVNTYKMTVDINSDIDMKMQPKDGEAEVESTKMTGTMDASIQYSPLLMYMTQNMKMNVPAAGEEPVDVNTEILMNKDGMYMTLPEQDWVKMEIPGMDMGKIMEQSMAQDPIASMKQMKEMGMSVSFANDGERDGKKYWIIEVVMGADALNKYLQQSMGQIPGVEAGTQNEILNLYENLILDMSYRTFINQDTLITDYMDLNAKYVFGMDVPDQDNPGHMDMNMDMDVAYKLYDFGVSFDVPDVSNAKDFNEVMKQSIEAAK